MRSSRSLPHNDYSTQALNKRSLMAFTFFPGNGDRAVVVQVRLGRDIPSDFNTSMKRASVRRSSQYQPTAMK
jgi:hypothetical protein